jgi:hypothetical protein
MGSCYRLSVATRCYGVVEQGRRRMEWKEANGCVERIHAMPGVWDYEFTGIRRCIIWVAWIGHCTAFEDDTASLYK